MPITAVRRAGALPVAGHLSPASALDASRAYEVVLEPCGPGAAQTRPVLLSAALPRSCFCPPASLCVSAERLPVFPETEQRM